MSNNFNLFNLIDFKSNPNGIAIVDSDKEIFYRYSDLEDFVNRAAFFLKQHGVRKNQKIVLISSNTPFLVFLYLAILKIGAVAVFVNKKYPQDILLKIIDDCQPFLIFIDSSVFLNIESFLIENIFLNSIKYLDSEIENIDEDQVAIIMYTSGSTGMPKGVMLTHKNHSWIIKKRVKEKNRVIKRILITSPLYHMTALSNLEISLFSGCTTLLMNEFSVEKFFKSIEKYQVDQISTVPAIIAMIIKFNNNKVFLGIRSIIMGSSPVSQSLYKQIKETFPNAYLKISYGITEVGPGLFDKHPAGISTPETSVGYPIDGIDYRLVDGVLQIKSPTMMKSYTKKLYNHLTDDGFFITNDLFEVDKNGFYYFRGRADDMFVCGGYNIYPKKIENLLESYEGIEQAVVISVKDDIKGHKPYAFVISNLEINNSIFNYLKTHLLPSEIPRKIWKTDSIPLNSSNKIDKNYLTTQANLFLKNEK